MSLEGGGYLVHQKSSPQLSKNFHEHNRANILNASGGGFRNRDKPFPFPGGWNVTGLPHCSEAFIGLCNHLWLPVLEMFILKARRATGGVLLFGFVEGNEFLQRGRLVEKGVQVSKHRFT